MVNILYVTIIILIFIYSLVGTFYLQKFKRCVLKKENHGKMPISIFIKSPVLGVKFMKIYCSNIFFFKNSYEKDMEYTELLKKIRIFSFISLFLIIFIFYKPV
jgi:hypothetical protein